MSLQLTDQLADAVAALCDAGAPISHGALDMEFQQAGLGRLDPGRQDESGLIGKSRRVASVLRCANSTAPDAGARLTQRLLERLQSAGYLNDPANSDVRISALRQALSDIGYELTLDGRLRPTVLEGLKGREMSSALRSYADRARANHDDAALLAGTSKDLMEATARHVLDERIGSFNNRMPFPGTMRAAMHELRFDGLDEAFASYQGLDRNAVVRFGQALYIMSCALNALRNQEGTGHGRPWLPDLDQIGARHATEAAGLICGVLLDRVDASKG